MSQPDPTALLRAPAATQHRFQHAGLTWLDLLYPGVEHVAFLRAHYPFHPLHLESLLERGQRPHFDIDAERGYTFVVLHFPVYDEMSDRSSGGRLIAFVGQDYLITLHEGRLSALRGLRRAVETSDVARLMGSGPGFLLYQIVSALVDSSHALVHRLETRLDEIEDTIFDTSRIAIVQRLSDLRREVISLRRIVRPSIAVLRELEGHADALPGLDPAYAEKLADGLLRVWEELEEQKDIIEGLDATYASLSSHRINREMKVFTLISTTMLPMTLLASVMGMNVLIPFADHPLALPIVLIVMVLLLVVMVELFRRRQLL